MLLIIYPNLGPAVGSEWGGKTAYRSLVPGQCELEKDDLESRHEFFYRQRSCRGGSSTQHSTSTTLSHLRIGSATVTPLCLIGPKSTVGYTWAERFRSSTLSPNTHIRIYTHTHRDSHTPSLCVSLVTSSAHSFISAKELFLLIVKVFQLTCHFYYGNTSAASPCRRDQMVSQKRLRSDV